MTDAEILRQKLNLEDSLQMTKARKNFSQKIRDEIGTCPFIEVHPKLKDETHFFVQPYPMREEQKKIIQKEMDRLEHLGIFHKGLTSFSSLVVLVKKKEPEFVQGL